MKDTAPAPMPITREEALRTAATLLSLYAVAFRELAK